MGRRKGALDQGTKATQIRASLGLKAKLPDSLSKRGPWLIQAWEGSTRSIETLMQLKRGGIQRWRYFRFLHLTAFLYDLQSQQVPTLAQCHGRCHLGISHLALLLRFRAFVARNPRRAFQLRKTRGPRRFSGGPAGAVRAEQQPIHGISSRPRHRRWRPRVSSARFLIWPFPIEPLVVVEGHVRFPHRPSADQRGGSGIQSRQGRIGGEGNLSREGDAHRLRRTARLCRGLRHIAGNETAVRGTGSGYAFAGREKYTQNDRGRGVEMHAEWT